MVFCFLSPFSTQASPFLSHMDTSNLDVSIDHWNVVNTIVSLTDSRLHNSCRRGEHRQEAENIETTMDGTASSCVCLSLGSVSLVCSVVRDVARTLLSRLHRVDGQSEVVLLVRTTRHRHDDMHPPSPSSSPLAYVWGVDGALRLSLTRSEGGATVVLPVAQVNHIAQQGMPHPHEQALTLLTALLDSLRVEQDSRADADVIITLTWAYMNKGSSASGGSPFECLPVVNWMDTHFVHSTNPMAQQQQGFVQEIFRGGAPGGPAPSLVPCWGPFFEILHPRHKQCVFVGIASESEKQTLQQVYMSLQNWVVSQSTSSSSNDKHPNSRSGNEIVQRIHVLNSLEEFLRAELVLLRHFVDPITQDRNNVVGVPDSATLLTSPPPKDPKMVVEDRPLLQSPPSREMTVLHDELIRVDAAESSSANHQERKAVSVTAEPSMPNASTFVTVDAQKGIVVASVFDRLLPPKQDATAGPSARHHVVSPSPNRPKPFLAGAAAHGSTSGSATASEMKATNALIHSLRAQIAAEKEKCQKCQGELLREREERNKHNVSFGEVTPEAFEAMKKKLAESEAQFEATIRELTQDAERRVTEREMVIARLKSSSQQQPHSSGQATTTPDRREIVWNTTGSVQAGSLTPQKEHSDAAEKMEELRTALRDATIAQQRMATEKIRLQDALQTVQADSQMRTAQLEDQLRRQQARFESETAKKLAAEATAHEARFQMARNAMEGEMQKLSEQVHLLKQDKKNLVTALRSIEMARQEQQQQQPVERRSHHRMDEVSNGGQLNATDLDALQNVLESVRSELAHARLERDRLLRHTEEKDSQLATLRKAFDIMRQELAEERQRQSNNNSTAASFNAAASSLGPSRGSTATAPQGSVHRRGSQNLTAPGRQVTQSPTRPGLAFYMMQQKSLASDASELSGGGRTPTKRPNLS